MKHLVVTLICFLWGLGLNAQDISNNIGDQTDSVQEEQVEVVTTYDESGSLNSFSETPAFNFKKTKQWKKYKVLNTLGWCFTGIGAGTLGFAIWFASTLPETDITAPKLIGGIVIGVTVLTFTAITVPLFVVAHRNKVAAKRMSQLSLSLSPVNTPGMGTFKPQQNLALGLRYTF